MSVCSVADMALTKIRTTRKECNAELWENTLANYLLDQRAVVPRARYIRSLKSCLNKNTPPNHRLFPQSSQNPCILHSCLIWEFPLAIFDKCVNDATVHDSSSSSSGWEYQKNDIQYYIIHSLHGILEIDGMMQPFNLGITKCVPSWLNEGIRWATIVTCSLLTLFRDGDRTDLNSSLSLHFQ